MNALRSRNALISVGAFLFPLALYIASCYYDVTYWDVGEMDTVPWILGIAHPPGFPAYVVMGWLFAHAVPLGSVAFRMSLLSAVATSAAAWCIARMVVDATDDWPAGFGASALFACGLTIWTRATRAEVHAVETAFFAAALLYAMRWYRAATLLRFSTRGGNENDRNLLFAAIFYGVAVAVHPVALLALPGFLILLVSRLNEAEPRQLGYAFAIAAALAIVWFAYLPMRSAFVSHHGLDPVASLGLPGSAFWDYNHPSTPEGFFALIGARDINVHGAMTALFNADAVPMAIANAIALLSREGFYIGLLLALTGAAVVFRRDRIQAIALFIVICSSAGFASTFHDESDRARYFMQVCVVCAYFSGAAIAWLRVRFPGWRTGVNLAVTLIVVALIVQGRVLFGQPHDLRARNDMAEVVAKTPDNAIIVSTWVLAPPLAYAAYVEGSVGHRTIVPAWYGDTADVLVKWVRSRPVYVCGKPEGSVADFRLERLGSHTELYRVVHL